MHFSNRFYEWKEKVNAGIFKDRLQVYFPVSRLEILSASK